MATASHIKSALLGSIFLVSSSLAAQNQSVARQWNEILLQAIRKDFARPIVHARNLFHISAAMYDAWAAYEENTTTYFLGQEHLGMEIVFDPTLLDLNRERREQLQEEALSYAVYRLIEHRFQRSPGWEEIEEDAVELMSALNYDRLIVGTDYSEGGAAELGNYIAQSIINYGLDDGSNERQNYLNTFYQPVNTPLKIAESGSQGLTNANRWQPLQFEVFIDQSGNELPGGSPQFLGAEWGNVVPFALNQDDARVYNRNGEDYTVYLDPGPPSFIDESSHESSEEYRWGFTLVAEWSSHLDPENAETIDISPNNIGNIPISSFPSELSVFKNFYSAEGGDIGSGYDLNPITNRPYETQIVKRGDYARVLAEFWADGPDSETPPGHWFVLLNDINDHPMLEKRFEGTGDIIGNFEWDIKSYFLLGATMHDAAIAAWSVKGYYDYIRPVSAIRYMASLGQSSNSDLPNFHFAGMALKEGFVEIVEDGDPLAGTIMNMWGRLKFGRGKDTTVLPTQLPTALGWDGFWPKTGCPIKGRPL